MRLLHPTTLRIVATELEDSEFDKATVSRKQIISHAWSECLKWLATGHSHPKMFIDDMEDFGKYMKLVKYYGNIVGCNLNEQHVVKYDDVWFGYLQWDSWQFLEDSLEQYFDFSYSVSDAMSLYLKGANLYPYLYGEEWRKYVPIENLNEIYRVVGKTLGKDK